MVNFSKQLSTNTKPSTNPCEPIQAGFVIKIGTWLSGKNKYTNIRKQTSTRQLTMVIESTDRGRILRFIGGPTGHETYYIDMSFYESIQRLADMNKEFCICAGTTNRWAECMVSARKVYEFLNKHHNR